MAPINVNGIFYDSNAYLTDTRRKALVDAGIDASRVMKKIPKNLELIVLTHCHYDHIAAVPEIVHATGAEVAMHSEDVELLMSEFFTGSAMFGARMKPIHVDRELEDGDTISLGDRDYSVIHTPGHTPGSICLYDEATKELFTGDTVFEGGGFGRTDLGGNPVEMVRSLERLSQLDVSAFFPGHGGAVHGNVKKWIDESLSNAKMMLF